MNPNRSVQYVFWLPLRRNITVVNRMFARICGIAFFGQTRGRNFGHGWNIFLPWGVLPKQFVYYPRCTKEKSL
jgi:hypothetical protein